MVDNSKRLFRHLILLGVTLIIIGAAFIFVDPIPQDPAYHHFADQRGLMGVPNFLNVVSNLAFVIVGCYGLVRIIILSQNNRDTNPQVANYVFFTGLLLTGLGSGFYHLSPNNQSLVWDRLPMTIAFMALFTFFVTEHISERVGKWLLWPLITLGILSVVYWVSTENHGVGDLRWYGLVQFLPIVLIPLIMFLFPSPCYQKKYFWYVIGLYVLAKLTEHFDAEIMNWLLVVSGHSLKHVVAALSGIAFLSLILSRNNTTKFA